MKGGSISLPNPFRNLDGHGPVGVLFPRTPRGLEVQLLQTLDDGTDAPRSYGTVVDLDDWCDLEPRPREEHLVSRVELGPADLALDDLHPKLVGRKLHD